VNKLKRGESVKELQAKTVRSIERALAILNCFSFEERELSISDFTEKTNLSRATIYRILQTLQKWRYIRYDSQTERYRLSVRLIELGAIANQEISLQREIAPFLDKLFQQSGHTILLATLEEDRLLYLDKRERPEGLKVSSTVGKLRDPDFGILGKTLMAYLPAHDQQRILHQLESSRTPQQLAALKERLAQIPKDGFLYASNETSPGVAGVAAPLFHRDGLAAVIGVLVPCAQLDSQKIDQLIRTVRQAAMEISEFLGYTKGE
jgi:DNA-binding IclR family transcriptional regulator